MVSPDELPRGESLFGSLHDYESVSLEQIGVVALRDRVEDKFLLSVDQLPRLLRELRASHRCLLVEGRHEQRYVNLYYDTTDFLFYRMHHDGRGHRLKLRKRWYLDSGVGFLEVKRRSNRARTDKTRLRLPSGELPTALGSPAVLGRPTITFSRKEQDWLTRQLGDYRELHFHPTTWHPTTWTFFRRITLVNLTQGERLTIDHDLGWGSTLDDDSPSPEGRLMAPNLCVVELKRNARGGHCPASQALLQLRVSPSGFSKYCIGTALFHPELKRNLFQPTLRRMETLRR